MSTANQPSKPPKKTQRTFDRFEVRFLLSLWTHLTVGKIIGFTILVWACMYVSTICRLKDPRLAARMEFYARLLILPPDGDKFKVAYDLFIEDFKKSKSGHLPFKFYTKNRRELSDPTKTSPVVSYAEFKEQALSFVKAANDKGFRAEWDKLDPLLHLPYQRTGNRNSSSDIG